MGSNGWTVVHRWIGTCSMTEELKAGGTDYVSQLVSWSLTSLFSTDMAISETNGHSL